MSGKGVFTLTVEPTQEGLAAALVELLAEAQKITGISNRALEKMSGVHNQNIGRVRNLQVDPTCGTLSRLFAALSAEGVEVMVTLKVGRPARKPASG